jgi:hypothetical protein
LPYGLGRSPSRSGGASILAMLIRIVAFSAAGAALAAGSCARATLGNPTLGNPALATPAIATPAIANRQSPVAIIQTPSL